MIFIDRIWLRIGNYYRRRQDTEKALKYIRKGQKAIQSLNDQIIYAELLHYTGHSDEAVEYLGQVIEWKGAGRAYERRAHILREMNREEEAITDLNEAILLDGDNYLTWYTRGIAYKDLGKYDEAIRDLKESIKREDRSTVISTYYELGMTYFESGNPAEAVSCFKESISLPDRVIPMYYFMLARCLDLIDSVEEALTVLRQGIELADRYEAEADQGYGLFDASTNYSYGAFMTFQRQTKESFSFRRLLADLYLQLGQYEKGVAAASEGLQKYAGAVELYLKRAEIYAAWGKNHQAKEDLELALHQDPNDFRAYFELARLYREEESEEKAAEVITKLYRLHPESPLVCYWMADCFYRMGQHDKAIQLNDKLLEMENDDPANYTQRADICIEMGNLPSAEQALNEALKLSDLPEIHNKQSYVMYLQGKNEEALLELQKAVSLDPDFAEHPTYLTASGHIYKEMGLWELAIDAYTKVIHMNPGNPRLYEFRAVCFLETEQLDRGLSDCTQGIELDPSYAGLYSLRSGIYLSMMDYTRARIDIMNFLELQPGHPGAYYRLGQIHYKDNDEEAALEAFDEVLNIMPEHAESYLYKAHIYFQQLEPEETVQNIVNWSLHLSKESSPSEKIKAIEALEGFDETILERAVEKLTEMYGHQLYLS
ncbi:Tetratricopeptide repeat-containing protein [Paenibacillus uliginis N3/975]|uniref:Tetratricopeptide repeat-containing protein n=1 Tax=Paenibacillus uliginis N3/975 TaxID=1313296 RepID=A0A1X7HN07_9BACL|nr:tetratricopeptide repeat protein [Paenibacillus uliginis]SMF89717.1 Tetratricopeptide repeat-containing protein [Paenibacillus uliginis N3/975]